MLKELGKQETWLISDNNFTLVHHREEPVYLQRDVTSSAVNRAHQSYVEKRPWTVFRLLSGDPIISNFDLWNEVNGLLLPADSSLLAVKTEEELWNDPEGYKNRQRNKKDKKEIRVADYRRRYFTDTAIDPRMPEYLEAIREKGYGTTVMTSLSSITEELFIEEMLKYNILGYLNKYLAATQRDDETMAPIDYKVLGISTVVEISHGLKSAIEVVDDDDRICRTVGREFGTEIQTIYVAVPYDLAKAQYKDPSERISLPSYVDIRYGWGIGQIAGLMEPFKDQREYGLYRKSLFDHVAKASDRLN